MDLNFNIDTEALWTQLSFYGLNLVAALAIFVLGKWAAKILVNVLRKMMTRANVDATLVSFGGNVAYALLMTFVIIAALNKLGVETASLVAIMAAAGLAIGLALQGSLSNLAAGVMIILFRPFKIGDYIDAGGTAGSVEGINIFTSTLKTPDNKVVIIPNSQITDNSITNFSARDTRRLDLVFGIGYDDDIKKARDILEEIIAADDRVLKDPAPKIAVLSLGDNSVNFAVRPWVKTSDYWELHFGLMETVKLRFDAEGISIPFPQRDVHLHGLDKVVELAKKAA